jgi:hypothetical protein
MIRESMGTDVRVVIELPGDRLAEAVSRQLGE